MFAPSRKMSDCVFCNIIEGRASGAVVCKEENFIALMDKYPITPGHTLVMPVKHYESILNMPHDEVGRLFILVAKVARGVKHATEAAGLNIGQNNGRVANQLIPHVHVHVIPRYPEDRPSWGRPSRQLSTTEELAKWAESIKSKMDAE